MVRSLQHNILVCCSRTGNELLLTWFISDGSVAASGCLGVPVLVRSGVCMRSGSAVALVVGFPGSSLSVPCMSLTSCLGKAAQQLTRA